MGLTRQYLRYGPAALFGLVGSARGRAAFVTLRGERGRCVAVPACEHVFVWDTRKGEKVRGEGREGERGAPGQPPRAWWDRSGGMWRVPGAVGSPGTKLLDSGGCDRRRVSPPGRLPFSEHTFGFGCGASQQLGAPWASLTADPVRFVFGASAGEEQSLQ